MKICYPYRVLLMSERNINMESVNKKRVISLGVRIGSIYLMTVIAVIAVAYFVLAQNFQTLMSDYTMNILRAMTSQGVQMIEGELETGRHEITFLANSLAESGGNEEFTFPQFYHDNEYIRMLYVTAEGTTASDGRERDIQERQDIQTAFKGETAVYGPYYNEEGEYVVCYSAPVREGEQITGVLSVEKDGYIFCELIKNIRFIHSGESYIINADGTDIAVSDETHMNWVTEQYNARKLLEEERDEETESILELEEKGLNGETGVGTYYWEDGLVYVFYEPVPSEGWLLLSGLREEEIVSLTQGAMFDSISNGSVLAICLLIVILLTALIVYWIFSSMKRDVEINEKLEIIANYDALTGLKNRSSFQAAIRRNFNQEQHLFACVYVDVNGLHELNNHLGHQAGDRMLKEVADALSSAFSGQEVYRIGGDEFVILSWGLSEAEVYDAAQRVRQSLREENHEISLGIIWRECAGNISELLSRAEEAMLADKEKFYQSGGHDRRMRKMDKNLEKMIAEKQDADTFLAVLAPEFKGVYFVNLSTDAMRELYIPEYFDECLRESDNQFSRALILYAGRIVKPEYRRCFEALCDYEELERQLENGHTPEVVYQKINGEWLKVRILKFRSYTEEKRETLWIFTNTENPGEDDF